MKKKYVMKLFLLLLVSLLFVSLSACEISFYSDGDISIYNDSGLDIVTIYITEHLDPWGSDWLYPGEVVLDMHYSPSFSVSPGRYDIRVYDESGYWAEALNILVSSGSTTYLDYYYDYYGGPYLE